jgi:hypothetical protein
MELFLNILWVAIAVGALGVWRIVWNRQRCQFSRTPLQEWTAFTCALVFVFFAVSLSDDLQAATILADDCASGRHHSLVWSCGHAPDSVASATHASLATEPAAPFADPLQMVARVTHPALKFRSTVDRKAIWGRGPPAIFP